MSDFTGSVIQFGFRLAVGKINNTVSFTFGDKIHFILEDTKENVYTNTLIEYHKEKMDFSPKSLKSASHLFGRGIKGGV